MLNAVIPQEFARHLRIGAIGQRVDTPVETNTGCRQTHADRLYWRAWDDEFHFGLKVAEDLTIGPFVSLYKDSGYLGLHPDSWEAWGSVLDDLSGALAIFASAKSQ